MPRKVNRENLAWAAGIIDGEGNIRTRRSGGVHNSDTLLPVIDVAQATFDGEPPEMLLRLQRIFPFKTSVYGPYAQTNPKSRDQFRFSVTGFERVQAFVAMVWPWLTPQKKAQAQVALSGYLASGQTGRGKWSRDAKKGK